MSGYSTIDPPPELLKTASALYESVGAAAVTQKYVSELSTSHGCDIATALLYHHFESLRSQTSALTDGSTGSQLQPAKLLIIPGAFYREHPHTGADGSLIQEIADQRGWPTKLIETNSVGRQADNVKIVQEQLDTHENDRCIIVSVSRGTSDTAQALLDPTWQAPAAIAGWVSLSGVWSGSPIVDWLTSRFILHQALKGLCRVRGIELSAIEDLGTASGRLTPSDPALHSLDFPVLHVAGLPTPETISTLRSRFWHRRLRRYGPNDGLMPLADLLDVPGSVIPVWGADHYLANGWDQETVFVHAISSLLRRQPSTTV